MNQTIEARMQYIDNELKAIRKELEESLGGYRDKADPLANYNLHTANPHLPVWDVTTYYRKGCLVKWPDGSIMKAKSNTIANIEDWYDPTKCDIHGNIVEIIK